MMEQRSFRNSGEFREWLSHNHKQTPGIWILFYKGKGRESLKHKKALEEALCYGWIDSLIKRIDQEKYLVKFTPRQKKSKWSKKNKDLVGRLIKEGRMTEWGYKAVDRAKETGAWENPRYFIPKDEHITRFTKVIKTRGRAYENFTSLPASAKKQFAGFYFEAKKEETRKKRLEKIIKLLEENKRLM